MDCIFCKIIKGEIPSYKIYEDDAIYVFMDIDPVNDGHMLIIPKEHYTNLSDIDEEVLSHIHKISKKMYVLLKEKLNIDGLTVTQNNEYGQEVKHYHLHLMPRVNGDTIRWCNTKDKKDIKEVYELLTK